LLKALLESMGYTVMVAEDGEQAVMTFRNSPDQFDLVISDVGLPKKSGWDAFLEMKKISATLKLILASGYLDEISLGQMLKEGVGAFVQKPYVPNEILRKVRDVLDGREER
jgi:DNA-binding response OmpR family regulator